MGALKEDNDLGVTMQELVQLFKDGAPIRGLSTEVKPTFWQKVKLVFDKEKFKVRCGGADVDFSLNGRAKTIFSKRFTLRAEGKIMGRGIFEPDLLQMGFTKSELKRYVDQGLLQKKTVTWQKAWRTTYVCLMPVEGVK